ncbi:Protein of unknown function [Cotesia congregata]|uniref:Reverse transcriptase domain-containing protein n=1 Tax=Cotesia congregata TaxID=51543 RepID=A0A8J2HHS6_COTCN|nr:Protein of unknown function [Cotesia congregata]
MPELLNDPLVYLQTNKDPTRKYQDKVNGIIAVLLEESVICDQKARYLKAHNTLPPRLYELRKIHKPGCKLRPVVSCIKSPCYKLAKFLHGLLTPLINTFEFNIRNSTEMVRFINNTRLPPDYILVSLDVVSLFTNIPKALVLEIINEEYETIRELVKVSKGKLCSLINVCFKTSYFTFNNVFYLQLDGSSMGNPASPVLANLVMDYRNNYPTKFIDCCINKFKSKHMDERRDNLIADKQENRFRFPYIRGLSQNIMRCFRVTDWKPAFYNIKKAGDILD